MSTEARSGFGRSGAGGVQHEADRAGPDERIGREGASDLPGALARAAGEADEDVEGQDVEERHHGGDRDRHQGDAARAEQAAGDASATKVFQRVAPWNTDVKLGPSSPIARSSSRPQREERAPPSQDRPDQRPADAEHRHRGEIRPREGVDDERREEDHVGDPLEPGPLPVVRRIPSRGRATRSDDEEDRDEAGEDGGHGALEAGRALKRGRAEASAKGRCGVPNAAASLDAMLRGTLLGC